MNEKPFIAALSAALLVSTAFANHGSAASQSSLDLSSQGLSEIAQGSAHFIQGGSEFTVVSLQRVGQLIYLTLQPVKSSATLVIKLSASAAGHFALSAGQTLVAVATASGYLLEASGRVLAFIPNEIGRSLIYSSRL